MNYTVLDLFSSLKSVSIKEGRVCDFDNLDPLFVEIHDSPNTNKASFAINSSSINATEIILADNRGFRVNYEHLYHVTKMLARFQYAVSNSIEKDYRRFNISLEKSDESQLIKHTELLMGQWFNYELKSKSTLKTQNKRIVPIPDNYSAEAQDSIIRSLGGSKNVRLVYRPIAAFIALEDKLKMMNVEDGKVVQVLDFNNLGIVRSELTVYRDGDRIIPGRTEFEEYRIVPFSTQFNYFGCRKLKISSPNTKLNCYSQIDNGPNVLGFEIVKNELLEVPQHRPSVSGQDLITPDSGMITITIGLPPKDPLLLKGNSFNCSNKELIRGSALCIDRISKGLTAYYDECKDLNMVIQTKYEEIDLRTIVNANKKIRGGFPVSGLAPIEDFSVLATSPVIKFYILLGTKERNVQLKVLEKQLDQEQLLKQNIEKLPILIQPSFTPGQGHPKFTVTVDNDRFPDFEPVEIDWDSITDAYFKTGTVIRGHYAKQNQIPVTTSLLEETIDRSFPVDIPAAEYDNDKTRMFLDFADKARSCHDIIDLRTKINRSSWPYKNEDGIKRFIRKNTFGMNVNGKTCYSSVFSDRVEKFYSKLEKCLHSDSINENYYLTIMAWTYNGERFSGILKDTLKQVEEAGKRHDKITVQKLTLCINLIRPDQIEFLVRLFIAYKNRMDYKRGDVSGASHWLRIGYQLFQNNTSFLEKVARADMYLLCNSIAQYYDSNLRDDLGKQGGYVLKNFLFALKYRRFYSNFLKDNNSSRPEELMCLKQITKIISSEKKGKNKPWADMLESYLNGRGTLDIPLEDDNDD